MNYKLIVFDFDGTLADTFPWAASIVSHLIAKYHLPPVAPELYDQLRNYDAKQVLQKVGVPTWKLPQIGRYVRRLMAEQIDQIHLFPGVDGLLETLVEGGLTLAMVSSNGRENVCQVLGPANAARFEYFECGVSLFGKPAKLRKVLRHSHIAPGQAMLIGDEVRDLEAAQTVGMAAGAVAWGYNYLSALQAHQPDMVFMRVEEIAQKLV